MCRKEEVISFKVDESLSGLLKSIPNRSEFIRAAVLMALGRACPLCNGTGSLSPIQKDFLQDFLRDHSLQKGQSDPILVCSHRHHS